MALERRDDGTGSALVRSAGGGEPRQRGPGLLQFGDFRVQRTEPLRRELLCPGAIFGGIEVPVWRKLSAGAEAGWRTAKVKDPRGAMGAFGEKNLGGVTFRVMLSFRN